MVKNLNAALTDIQSTNFEAKKSNSCNNLGTSITIEIEQTQEAKDRIPAIKKQIKKDKDARAELKTQMANSVKALVKNQYLSPNIQSFDQYMSQALENSNPTKDHEMTDTNQAQYDTNVNSSPRISNTSSIAPNSPSNATGDINLILTESQNV